VSNKRSHGWDKADQRAITWRNKVWSFQTSMIVSMGVILARADAVQLPAETPIIRCPAQENPWLARPLANPSSKAVPNAPPPKATVSSSDLRPNTRWTLASVVAGKSMITP
jgi:hypothetical protein